MSIPRDAKQQVLTTGRYVEDTLEHNKKFDAQGLVAQDRSREGRLKYWDNELCAKHPHTFDFAVTVCVSTLGMLSS